MSFCRITGRSRGLPKPNYFPLLAPISPADAKRCCRITGKSYGLPSHHYIPVLLTSRSSKNKCKITNVAGELGPHHYSPEFHYGNRKHDILPDYRYIFPILDGSTEAQKALMEMLLSKQVTEEKRYVYTVQERRCSLVFSAQMEAAVRDGDVRDVMLAKDSDTVLIKTKQGRNVSMDFRDFTEDVEMYEGEGPNAEVLKQREIVELEERKKKRKRAAGLSSMKKIFENKEILAEVQELEEENLRKQRISKKAKLEKIKHEKQDLKSFTSSNFDLNHMRNKSSIVMCSGEWKDQIHPIIDSWDWEAFEKDVNDDHVVPKLTALPTPVKLTPYHCDAEILEVDRNISDISVALENVPCVNPLKPIKSRPSEDVLSAVKELSEERLSETADVIEKLYEENKIGMLPTFENLTEVVKNISKGKRSKVAKVTGLTLDINKAKKFIPGQHINTPQGPVFVPGQTVETPVGPVFVPGLSINTPTGPGLIPGHVITNENTNEPFFLAGQMLQTSNGEEFVCGQTIKTKEDTYRFTEGQTVISEEGLKFVPGKIINTGPEDVFVPGQSIITPEGIQFIPGQTMTESNGMIFTPGQNAKINNEWQFVPGQVVHQDDELHFVPGATIATPNGLKFVPGQTIAINGETCFIPGITRTSSTNKLEFVPGTTVETIDGPKFIEGQMVQTDRGEKFLPGKTIVEANGHVEFSVAKSVEDITFTESTPVGLPIDIKTCSISEESLYVFGHMVQTSKGIEFYPGSKTPKIEGKVVPGRLVKNEANESRFVPGTMVEGIFVPGQVVFTENGEQFVPGQVVDTAEGPKFVPGQVVNTKSGPKFVPGQTIHTIDGPRFVPGQIVETKAGPTFIPGQVISTDEGSRFVPGQVVDTDEGPRFVPGRVIETDDFGVTFVPGQIVQTPEGLKFVAPDLTEGEEGLEFSVQSFVVTPEELKLLKIKTNPNDTTSTKGELTIDTNMLKQLSEAGMSIGRQVPTDLPAINVVLNHTRNKEVLKAFVTDFGLKDDVANQLMDVITSIIEMSAHLKSEFHENISDCTKSEGSSVDIKKSRNGRKRIESQGHAGFSDGNGHTAQQERVKNSIAAAVLAALVTAEQFEEVNNNNSKEKYQLILKSIDTILGKAIDEDFVAAMYQILQKEEDKEILCDEILEGSSQPKVELIKIAVNSALHKHSITEEDMIEKFGDFLSSENEVLGPAFKNIAKSDINLLRKVLSNISDSISFIKTDHEATESLQKAIVSAVQESSTKEIELILQHSNKKEFKELMTQSVGLARILGMRDVASKLLVIMNDEESLSKIATDAESLNILKRLTVMRKLADQDPGLKSALQKLETNTELARTDPKLRDLVRESAALMIIPEEPPLMSSADVPLSLLDPENSLAMEDFLFQRRKRATGALLIMKKGLQAVVPREASRAVLTGQVAYTVLDETGIRHFEPLHVFSALNLSQPTAHRFSMYSCPIVDDDDEDLQTFTGYCNVSNLQRITKFGGWARRYSGVLLDRENTRYRISSLDHTPSYKRYPSRSSTRSRSSCSRSPSKVEDVVVANSDYTAANDDEVSVKAGDIVEVLDTKTALGSKPPPDPSLDLEAELLDSSAALHKRAVRPKKNHPRRPAARSETNERWLVRVLEDVAGGEVVSRQGWLPAAVLQQERVAEQDVTALAARRQAVVRELIETEEEFGRDMQQVASRYMRPMDKATTPKVVFDNRELLFSNFKQITEFHSTALLEGIKYYAGEPCMLGRALLRMEREFDKHVAYCRDEPRAQHLLQHDPVVAHYFQDLADKLGDDKGLAEHLKLPIQRINDYQLLLKELVKYSQRIGDDSADLQKALELFLGVPNRATDNKFIASIEGYRGNIYKLGRLLTHDWFTVTDQQGQSKERYLFLFKARLLICKVKRVSDDRSVFVLKDIIKLPETEAVDRPEDPFRFELRSLAGGITLAAHKEPVKPAWLREIRQYSSDLVALAEHAADDLQVLSPPQVTSPEPEEKKKKREREEDIPETKEKRTKVEADSLQVESQTAKRKASLETEVASKISKSEVTEVSSSDVQSVHAKTEVTTGLETKSSVTASVSEVSQSVSQSQSTQQTVVAASVEKTEAKAILIAKVEEKSFVQSQQSSVEQAEFVETSKQTSQSSQQVSVQQASTETSEKAKEIRTASSSTIEEKSSVQSQQSSVEQTQSLDTSNKAIEQVSVQQASVEKAKEIKSLSSASAGEQKKVSAEKSSTDVVQKSLETTQISSEVKSQSSAEIKSQISSETKSQTSVEVSKQQESAKSSDAKPESSVEVSKQQESVKSSDAKSQASVEVNKQQESAKSSDAKSQSSVEVNKQQESAKSSDAKSQSSVEVNKEKESAKSSDVKSQSSVEVKNQQETAQTQASTESKTQSTVESKSKETSQSSVQSVQQSSTTKVESVEESHILTREESLALLRASRKASFGTDKTQESVQSSTEVVAANVEESSEVKVVGSAEGATVEEKVPAGGQTVTAEDATDDMSRYSRSSRLSGDYSSSSRRYESSGGYESSGLSSSYSRRESGSRYESAASAEGSAATRIESKYSSARVEGGSKYSVEGDEAVSKLDSIASKYGIESSYGSARSERTASKYSVDLEDDKLEAITSKRESRYESKNGDATLESKYSRSAVANGSVTNEFQSTKSILKSESGDGRPVFTKTLSGQNIEPGENAAFECQLRESLESSRVTWLKDNRPLTDKLMDRVNISTRSGQNRLEIMHCREDDSGVYTARAENTKGNAHCTAQLVVIELTAEERRERNALNAPYFLVALKDTEILLNTYLRFMVKVKGDPTPDVTFYRYGKEIKTTSESDRISINRTLADKGCYELVIADVNHDDAGKYSCKAVNVYGEVETEATVTVVDDKNIFFELPPGGEGLLAKGEKPVFAWKRDGEPFDPEERFKVLMGEDEDTLALVFQHVRPEDAGLYTCVAKTTTGSISCSAELTVQGAVNELHREPEKPTLIIEHKEAIVSAGASAMLELQCKGFPKPSVVFKHDGKIIEADTRHKFLYEDDESMSLVIKNVSSADAGDYLVTASNELGEDSTTLRLVVKAAPKVKGKVENQTCMVGSTHTVTIEVEGAPEPDVTFYKDGVEIKSSERIKIVKESSEVYKIIIKDAKLTDTGSYSIVAKNEVNQCSDFWQWHVTSPPRVTKKLGGDKVCDEKQTVTLQIEAEAEPAPTVTWYKNKTELIESSSVKISSSGSAHALVLAAAARADAGEYSCEIRNVHGSASDSCLVQVRGAPIFTQKLRDTTACEGDVNVEFTVAVEAYPEPTVRWYLGDVEITEKKSVFTRVDSGATHKLILKEVSAEYSGRYSCKVSNDLGSDACEATFTVKRKPRFTKSLIDMTVDTGSTLKLEVEVEGTPEPKVKWFKDGKEVNLDARIKIERDTQRLENYYLTVNIVKEEDGGEYEVTAENEMGSVSSKSTVTVHTTEVHSRLRKETIVENEIEDESKSKQKALAEEVDSGKKQKADKGKTKPEEAEEKSFWDDAEDGKAKKAEIEDLDKKSPAKAKKSLTEPEVAEEKSIWDDVDEDGKTKKPIIEEVDAPTSGKGKKSITEPEVAEEKSIWDENHNENTKQPIIEEVEDEKQTAKKSATKPEIIEEVPIDEDLKSPKRKSVKKQSVEEPMSAEREGRVFETVTTFKTADDGSIIMSKVSSSLSHGAIVTGPAETRTLHKMTSTAVFYDDDDDIGRKIIQPTKPHKTSLEVEEIASHSYFMSELGNYTVPDYVRRGTYGIIEEPATDSEADNSSRCGRQYSIRTASAMSLSEDETSWRNDSLSREISIEDLSKSIFDIDDTRKVFSKDSYVRQSSFKEDYFTDEGEEESFILKEKSQKVFENDITDKLIHISKEFDENDFKDAKTKLDDIKSRIIEEFVLSPSKNNDNITKDVSESSVERKRQHVNKLYSVEEEVDDELEALLKRSQRQRSILDDILTEETEKAPPTIKDSSMKDSCVYESLPLVYTVSAVGAPQPVVKWLHNGKEVKQNAHVHISKEGDLYKLAIDSVEMADAGKWQCEISNDLGKKVQNAELSVNSVSEFRKPIFTSPLEAQQVMQREPVTLQAVCTADPQPHVSWLLNGVELTPDATIVTSAEAKDIEHGLKECTFKLHIPTGRHADTGVYTIKAKNQYGVGESSARLDILLRPEIEGLKDVTAVPYEETTFVANIRANPVAEVKWSKDGYAIQPSTQYDVVADTATEQYKLVVKSVGVGDAGVYTVTAKNEHGETAQQAKLTVHTNEPVFTKPLQKETVKDYDDATLKVRCDGVPKPEVHWYKDGVEIENDERRTVTTVVGGQVDSELAIQHFNASDAGKYKVRAMNLAGEASCEAAISLAAAAPGFAQRLDRQRDVDEGEPLELKCKLDGSPVPKAKWYKDGAELSPADPRIVQTALPDGSVKLSIARATPADCGAYKLVVSNPHGENSALCAVAVNPTPRRPSFSQELEDVKAVVGQPLKLEARVMAFPAPEVKWFKDGLPIRPSQAVNFINQPGGLVGLSIDVAKPEDAGVYRVTVANKLGEIASQATVEVGLKERKPAFIAELMPTKVIEGFPVKLEVKVLGHPQPTIKWTHNGKEIIPDGQRIKVISTPDGSHALLISEAAAADAGEYGVVAINDKGETGCKAKLDVASRANDSSPQERPQLIHGLRDVTAEEGQPLLLSAPFVGNPVPDVAWTKDGVPLKPSERVLITCDGRRVGIEIEPVDLADAGVYGVRLTNPLGEDASEGTVHVRKVYQPPAFTQKFTDLQQLPTFDGKFPARVSGVPTPEISWYKDGQPLRHTDKYNIKRDGDACCLYVRDLTAEDAGRYKCVAKNREGEATCEANLDVVDKIARKQKIEPPYFLKRIGDTEVLRGMSAKFTACAAGEPEPDVEWYRNDERLFPCERIRMDKETTGLLRLTVSGVDPNTDVGVYKCRIYNPHGEESCTARLSYDSLEPQQPKRPISDQYSDFDKMKKTGIPMPLADKPIISRMADRHLTLSWKPSIPHGPRFPVTYQVEMCEQPDGDWFTARTGLRSCVCDIRNLVPFRDYKFRVRVENQYGVSDPSPFAITHRAKLEPDPPKFIPYLEPGIDFRPETSPYFPKDFDIERPPHDQHAAAPRFLRQEHDSQYGVKGHNVNLFWFVYGYPKPKMTYFYNDEPIEIGGRYDWSYTRNGQATLFINKMLERDAGWYEAVATNEHGQARQRVRLEIAEYPYFIKRPEETVALQRRPARLEARVTGVPYPDIKWYKDWQPLAASARIKIKFIEPDTTILVINDAILKDEGLYSVSARNVAGSASASAMLHIEEDEHEYSDRIRAHPPRVSCSTKPFGELYDLGDELGRGVQGVAYHAAERLTGRNYAAKIMHGHSALKPFMKNELEIMNMLNDRHLVRLHDAYEHDHTLAIVMELAAGGELVRDRLLRSQGYSEREIAGYIRQLLRGLKYMHENSVAHLGLTIGELLLSHAGSDQLKICDFGLSRRIQFSKHGALDYGMPEYVAPEVASGDGVSFAADMWSVGIITYILLSGHSPFRGAHDRETLTRIREGKWAWHDEEWWSRLSTESRDFISKLLVFDWNSRMDVNAALGHPWLNLADKIYQDEYLITTDRLRNYYNLYRDWTSNAACRNWFRRRPLSGAFDHPSKMVYPPGEIYTPEGTPERDPHARSPAAGDLQFKQWDHPDWEVSAKSESHYQNGPDTYLLQLRDTQFPVRLREYMKVACHRSPAYYISVNDTYDPRTPIIRERRRFTDIMDEEIDDERRERINNYGNDRSYIIRRLRHELGTRLDSYAEAQAIMEAKKDGQLPFFREKPQIAAIVDGEPARLRCYAVGDPRPSVQWFKNDNVVAPGPRVDVVEDDEGRSTLSFNPARLHDVGFYKVVARNKVGQTVARARVVEASSPDAPDSPVPVQVSDTEVLLRWKQPKYDGNSPVQCYSLQYKRGDSVEWQDVGFNIDHEFYLVRDLAPDTSYQFRLSSRNKIAWSEKGIPTECVKTAASGAPKLVISRAMMHLQQMTESGQPIEGDEEKPRLSYNVENSPLDWDTTDAFTERYSFISELWRGKFSIVVKGVDKNTDSVVVAKILENRPDTEVQIQREFECLRRLRHERISNLLAAYQAPGSPVTAFILEKLQGADILTYLSSRHSYTEQVVATIVAQLLDGLQYLHWRGFCHLDLQPDNVVMASVRSVQVKLVDFGSAHKVSKLGTVVPQVGDLDYKSPEVVNDEPAFPQTDIWSVGVLAYVMLSGVSPFRGENDQETKQNISFVRYQFEHLYKEISQEATRFLMFLFKKVPQKRPSADECHEHRWLAQSDFMNKKRERTHFLGHRLRQFSEEYHERKAREASQADTVTAAFGKMQPRHLTRSNSIQEELETTFANVTK